MALKKKMCKNGHRLIATNLYVFGNKRECKKCAIARALTSRANRQLSQAS
jgi:hypothetical protein